MARLACIQHKSRVLVLETKTIHRSTGETCNSPLHIGNKKITADELRNEIRRRNSIKETP